MSEPGQQPQVPPYPGPQQYGQPGGYPPAGFSAPRTNTLAVISFIASLVGILGIIPLLASIAAVITGHIGLGQIKVSGEGGRGIALAGVIIGYVGILFAVVGILVLILAFAVWIPWASTYFPTEPAPSYATP